MIELRNSAITVCLLMCAIGGVTRAQQVPASDDVPPIQPLPLTTDPTQIVPPDCPTGAGTCAKPRQSPAAAASPLTADQFVKDASNSADMMEAAQPVIGDTPGVGLATDMLTLVNAADNGTLVKEAVKTAVGKTTQALVTAGCKSVPVLDKIAVPVGVAAKQCAEAVTDFLIEHPPDGTSWKCAKIGDCSSMQEADSNQNPSSLPSDDSDDSTQMDDAAAAAAVSFAMASVNSQNDATKTTLSAPQPSVIQSLQTLTTHRGTVNGAETSTTPSRPATSCSQMAPPGATNIHADATGQTCYWSAASQGPSSTSKSSPNCGTRAWWNGNSCVQYDCSHAGGWCGNGCCVSK